MHLPVQRMIRLSLQDISTRAEKFAHTIRESDSASAVRIDMVDGSSLLGGGSTPSQSLPTKLLRLASANHSATQLEARLREGATGVPVIARIEDDHVLLDLRTVFPEQDASSRENLARRSAIEPFARKCYDIGVI